ncbi:MAG: malonic semialdehyde reductase [Pelagibacteraceae bacterium]|nr:malonic semialdehyde reductase [Pelagibacteraceae bacterium]|tara:strand:- start:2439 stop:3020 length:582 start_codon:yes stop_codon:yes gene_type:complete
MSKIFLDKLFLKARSHYNWKKKEVKEKTLKDLYNLVKNCPTSANSEPMRILFLKSDKSKERLRPHLSDGNVDKTMTAPIVAIIAYDSKFYNHLPKLFPHNPGMKKVLSNPPAKAEITAFRNSTLQGGYFMIAARALGLDVGPMSGFNNSGVDKEFFSNGRFKSNFLCNLGYGDKSKLLNRLPRFKFSEVCKIL